LNEEGAMDEQGKPEPTKVCPICGGSDFAWGKWTERRLEGFREESTSWLYRMSLSPSCARKCRGCGNIQVFASRPPFAPEKPRK
jgi:hypothetical protein